MTVLWILLALLALIWLLLAMPLRFFITYRQDSLDYRLKYGPFCLADSKKPKKQKNKKTMAKSNSPAEKKSSGLVGSLLDFLGFPEISSTANAKKSLRENGIVGTLRAVFISVKQLFSRLGTLIKKGTFQKFHLTVVVADDDAADAALLYGQVCAAAFPLLDFLEHSLKIRNEKVDIRCDYDAAQTQVSFDGQLNYRPWHFVCFLTGLVVNYFKRFGKKEKRYE